MNATATLDHELPVGSCAECTATFRKVRENQRFCPRAKCRQKWYRRHEVRGGELYRKLYRMRQDRHLPAADQGVRLGDVTRMIDQYIREDAERGREAP